MTFQGHLITLPQGFIFREMQPTQFGKDNEVFCIALWAGYTCCAVASLFLVHPALQAGLVNPLGGAAAAARANPLCRAVIFVRGKAHPAAPKTNTHAQIQDETLKQTWLQKMNKNTSSHQLYPSVS